MENFRIQILNKNIIINLTNCLSFTSPDRCFTSNWNDKTYLNIHTLGICNLHHLNPIPL